VRYRDARHALCLPWVFAGFHLSHGLGVLAGLGRLATRSSPVQRGPAPAPAVPPRDGSA
jgi:hypothetical protein